MPTSLKAGHKTSEFLSAGGIAGVIAFHQEAGLALSEVQIKALTFIALAYVLGRSLAKAAEIWRGAPAGAADPAERRQKPAAFDDA